PASALRRADGCVAGRLLGSAGSARAWARRGLLSLYVAVAITATLLPCASRVVTVPSCHGPGSPTVPTRPLPAEGEQAHGFADRVRPQTAWPVPGCARERL